MSLTRTLLGFALALAIGIVCRLFSIPLPAPPAIIGALLVVSMTIGFLMTDWVMTRRETEEVGQ
ncbi:MAG: DUF1427 family protein [Pseudomonadota bacterium]